MKRAGMKRLLISRDRWETLVVLVEEGTALELYTERPGRQSRVGNIYKGRVQNVLAGMEAAFVDIGLDRNGYLSVDEVASAGGGGVRRGRKITELLRSGSELLVQIIRDEMGGKGPRLTTQISLAGRYVVYMPGAGSWGASRRLDDAERERLRDLCRSLLPCEGGLIARTAAEGADEAALQRDLRFLQRVWSGISARAAAALAPCRVYAEMELALRAVRDLSAADVDTVIVDDQDLSRRVANYLRTVAPGSSTVVEFYQGDVPLLDAFGLEDEARKALSRRVELPSGGYVVIDHTEAMTVIDVNTGRYVGKRFLEETSLKTNLEACREIVRQLRLRDIGGIVVIDFIDMNVEVNREAVLAELRAQAAADRTKTYVVALSPLGLVEMTRQNLTLGLREIMTEVCPTCRGEGRVLSEESVMLMVERRLIRLARESATPGLRVAVHPRMAALLQRGEPSRVRRVESESGRFVILCAAEDTVALDHVALVPD